MHIQTKRFQISTKGNTDIIDLTPRLTEIIEPSSMTDGQVTVFVPGSTAGVSVVEYEPGLLRDIPEFLEKIAPSQATYHHDQTWHDGNGHAHVRATLIGPSLTIPFEKKTLTLGTWQQVILLDFDNRARKREIVVQLMGM